MPRRKLLDVVYVLRDRDTSEDVRCIVMVLLSSNIASSAEMFKFTSTILAG